MSLWARFKSWIRYLNNAYVAKDRWFTPDKAIHAAFGAWIWLLGRVLLGPAFLQRAILAVVVTVTFELWQLARYLRWWNHGAMNPRPVEADLFSYKDVIWGLVGAFTALLMLWRLGVSP